MPCVADVDRERRAPRASSYDDASTFTQTSAATAAASRTAAPPVSVRRNSRSGVSRLRAQAVRPENGDGLAVGSALLVVALHDRRYTTGSMRPSGDAEQVLASGRASVTWRALDLDRARELLSAERERIERALGRLGHQDTGEPADEIDPANQASDLYQDELDEGLADDLREELAAVERAEAAPCRRDLRPLDRKRQPDSRRAARGRPDCRAHGGRGGAVSEPVRQGSPQ